MKYKFRGLTESGRWVYGCYLHTDRGGKTQCKDWIYSEPHIMRSNVFDKHEVLPETVSQWTGLQDKNKKDIFEGDRVYIPEGFGGDYQYIGVEGIITWERGCFYPHNPEDHHGMVLQDWTWEELEVIGNKWE